MYHTGREMSQSGKLYECKHFSISYIFLNCSQNSVIVSIINGHWSLQKIFRHGHAKILVMQLLRKGFPLVTLSDDKGLLEV